MHAKARPAVQTSSSQDIGVITEFMDTPDAILSYHNLHLETIVTEQKESGPKTVLQRIYWQ